MQRSRWGFLRNSWGRLRRVAQLPDHLCQGRVDLPGQHLQSAAALLHAGDLRDVLRRSLLWHDREWLRRLDRMWR